MPETFEQQLAKVEGTLHPVYMDDHPHRMQNGLLYYFSKADNLRKSTEILMCHGDFPDTYSMLAGMALEVLLKGTARALGHSTTRKHHRLNDLVADIGVVVTEDEHVILDAMSEHVIWAGRFTAPLRSEDWNKVWALQHKQRRRGGSLVDMDIASRAISIGNFRQLWAKLAYYFWRARDSRYESAEWRREQSVPT